MDSQALFEWIGHYVRLESISAIRPQLQLPLPVFTPPSAVSFSTTPSTTTPTAASVPSTPPTTEHEHPVTPILKRRLRSNEANSSPKSLPPSSPQHPLLEPAVQPSTPVHKRRFRSNIVNSPFRSLPNSPEQDFSGDINLPDVSLSPVRKRRFRSNTVNSPFRSLPNSPLPQPSNNVLLPAAAPSPLPQPNNNVLLPAAIVQPNVSLQDQLRSYVLPEILPAEQAPSTVLPVTVQRLRKKRLIRGTKKGDRKPVNTAVPGTYQSPLSALPKRMRKQIGRFDKMFLQQTHILYKWALKNRRKIGSGFAQELEATTPSRLAEQALALVPRIVKFGFAKDGRISLQDLKTLSKRCPPRTGEGNYLVFAYPKDNSFFALYGGMSQMRRGTLARCKQHASKHYRTKREKKGLYKIIDAPGKPTLKVSAIGLLNGTGLHRDLLYFWEACWVSLFGLYNKDKAHEAEILDQLHYGAVQFSEQMCPTNETCPLTERSYAGARRNNDTATAQQGPVTERRSRKIHLKVPRNTICSEWEHCGIAREEGYGQWNNHPQKKGLIICGACMSSWHRNRTFVRRVSTKFPTDHDGWCERVGCSARLLPGGKRCVSGRWICSNHVSGRDYR